jgi:hypothetical protein
MKRLFIIAVTVWLVGCSTLGDLSGVVPIAEAIKDDTNPAGLTSADAAYLGAYRSYAGAIKGKKEDRKPILEIEANDSGVIEIKAKAVRVYGPEQETKITAPVKPKNFSDRVLDFAEKAADYTFRYLLPIDLARIDQEREETRLNAENAARRQELGTVNRAIDSVSDTTKEVLNKVPNPVAE